MTMQINNLTHPGQQPQNGDVLEYIHDSGMRETKQFFAVQEPKPTYHMSIDLSTYKVAPGESVQCHIQVTDQDNQVIKVTDIYYVPIIRQSDGLQSEFLTVELNQGQAEVSFSLPDKGRYSIELSKITPKPLSTLDENPMLLVV